MTPERKRRLEKVLDKRQPDLTVVLENVTDPHNISAVMRTCDAVGVQEIHILNSRIPPHRKWGKRSSSSAAKWLTIHQYTDPLNCISALRDRRFLILATRLGDGAVSLYETDLTRPTALVFGNEHAGVSDEMGRLADGNIIIPQAGIIRSLNISVACAVSLYEAYRQKAMAGHYSHPRLSPRRSDEIRIQWGLKE